MARGKLALDALEALLSGVKRVDLGDMTRPVTAARRQALADMLKSKPKKPRNRLSDKARKQLELDPDYDYKEEIRIAEGGLSEDAIVRQLRKMFKFWPDGVPEGRTKGSESWVKGMWEEYNTDYDSPAKLAQAYNQDAKKAEQLVAKLNKMRKARGAGEWDWNL